MEQNLERRAGLLEKASDFLVRHSGWLILAGVVLTLLLIITESKGETDRLRQFYERNRERRTCGR